MAKNGNDGKVLLEHRLTKLENEIEWIKWLATGGLGTGILTVADLARMHLTGG